MIVKTNFRGGEFEDRSPRQRGVQLYRTLPVEDFRFDTSHLYMATVCDDGFIIERDDRLNDFLADGVGDYVFRMRLTKLFSGPTLRLYAIGFRNPVDEQMFRIAFG